MQHPEQIQSAWLLATVFVFFGDWCAADDTVERVLTIMNQGGGDLTFDITGLPSGSEPEPEPEPTNGLVLHYTFDSSHLVSKIFHCLLALRHQMTQVINHFLQTTAELAYRIIPVKGYFSCQITF